MFVYACVHACVFQISLAHFHVVFVNLQSVVLFFNCALIVNSECDNNGYIVSLASTPPLIGA